MPALIAALLPLSLVGGPLRPAAPPASPVARAGLLYAAVEPPTRSAAEPAAEAGPLDGVLKFVGLGPKEGEEGMTIEKVASLGLAGVLSIAVAETVFKVLPFPTPSRLHIATGEWIDLFSQEGQVKFLAFTVGWGGIGGIIAQYRTVLTAAAMTPWMDREVVQPYVKPWLESVGIADKFEFARKDGDDAAAEESEAPAEAAAPFEMPKFELPKDLSLPKLPEGFELPKLPKF